MKKYREAKQISPIDLVYQALAEDMDTVRAELRNVLAKNKKKMISKIADLGYSKQEAEMFWNMMEGRISDTFV